MDDWDLDTPRPIPAQPRPAGPGGSPDGPTTSQAGATPAGSMPAAKLEKGGSTAESGHPRRTRGWSKLRTAQIVTALLVFVAGLLIGFFVARSQGSEERAQLVEAREELVRLTGALSQSEDRNWEYYLATEALEAELESYVTPPSTGPESPPTTSTEPAFDPGRVYGDGVYVVGEDIAVGSYDGTVTGEIGYWARLKGTDGAASSIIANGLARGPFVLTIVTSDRAVELRGVELMLR